MPTTVQASSKTPIHRALASLHDPSASMCRVEFAAILFDLDDVLVDLTAVAADARSTVVLAGAHELTRQLQDRDVPSALVTAEQVVAAKPSPEPYRAAAEQPGVPATRCLVIEDAPAGVRAGNAAGAVTVAVSSSHTPAALAHADHGIGSLADVVPSTQSAGGHAVVEFACSAPAARGSTG